MMRLFMKGKPWLPGVLILCSGKALPDTYDGLPPPATLKKSLSEYTLWLTLEVNGRDNESVVPVTVRQDRYLVDAEILRHNHVLVSQQASGKQDVSELRGVKVSYDSGRQKLLLSVPDSWLPVQSLGRTGSASAMAWSSSGILLNYDAYSSDGKGEGYSALWLEQRWFTERGYLTDTGTLRHQWARSEYGQAQNYIRYDTTWRFSDADRLISYQAGDVISNSLSWSNSVRFGGVRISRSFEIRPDLVTYPLLNWSGTASVPGSLDLFINGYKASSYNVIAGPWTLINTPYINGAGEATVVTTDALGRQVSTSIPFYVSNRLLRPGLSDFDFTVGALRHNYGIRNSDYGATAGSGYYRYGLTDNVTLSAESEASSDLVKFGAGADVSAPRFGTVSLSASQSSTGSSGQQYSIGYSWFSPAFSASLSHVERTAGFSDLSVYNTRATLSRRTEQATVTLVPFGHAAGNIGLGYFDITARDGTRTRLANLSWSYGLWGNSSLHLALNKDLDANGISGQLQVTIPIGSVGTLTAGSQRSSNGGGMLRTLNYSQSTPVAGGLGWNLAASDGPDRYTQVDLTYKHRYTTLSGGVNGLTGNRLRWFDASGSVVWMDNSLFASNKINDAFIVVSTSGYPDVPVLYENQQVGRTDRSGHLLIPSVSAWYPARLTIDPMGLPASIQTPLVEQRIAVREGGGALINFPLLKTQPILLRLRDAAGHPLPLGIPVTEIHSGKIALTGYGGEAWFDNVPSESVFTLTVEGKECRQAVALKRSFSQLQPEPLTCPILISRKVSQ